MVWDKNGEGTFRRAGSTTPLAKRAPECHQRAAVVRETEHSRTFLRRVKKNSSSTKVHQPVIVVLSLCTLVIRTYLRTSYFFSDGVG